MLNCNIVEVSPNIKSKNLLLSFAAASLCILVWTLENLGVIVWLHQPVLAKNCKSIVDPLDFGNGVEGWV
jgi:hypothetical protein